MKFLITIIILFIITIKSFAVDCPTTNTNGKRFYVDKITKMQIENSGWVIFQYIQEGKQTECNESGAHWFTFDATGDKGKANLSLVLTALSTGKPWSFNINGSSSTHDGKLIVSDIRVDFSK